MTHFLFTNPGETAILHTKRKSLGRHAVIIISRNKNQRKTWPAISIKEHGRTLAEKGVDDEETTAPFPGSLILKQRKKEKKRNTRS